jgi:dTDP-glucose 4,6-dehydratase
MANRTKGKVLITGAAGFIGSHLCDKFLNEGYDVIGMDNFLTGREENLSDLFRLKEFSFYHHDVTKFVHVPGQVDYILHFASPASPADYLLMPIQTLKVGSLGTHNLLGLAKAKGATMLIASTSEVYGDPQIHPQSENYWGHVNPVGPRGVYDEAKRFQEAITMAYHHVHGVQTRIARIFNTYGPRMRADDGRAFPTFFMQALNHDPITIYGDGSQTRSFCFINDLIEGIYKLLLSDYSKPVNLGNPDEVTILELANEIKLLSNSKSELSFNRLPTDDPKKRQPDISLANQLLDWKPMIERKQGINLSIEYFKRLRIASTS